MTLDDPYFLTEALYAPVSQLTNIKQATLHIITIKPDNWSSDSDAAGIQILGSQTSSRSQDIAQQSLTDSTQIHDNSDTSKSLTNIEEKLDSACEGSEVGTRKHTLSCVEPEAQEKSIDDVKQMGRDPNPTRSKVRKLENKGDAADDTSDQDESNPSGEATDTVIQTKDPTEAGDSGPPFTDQRWLVELQDKLKGQPYILDIDLDFYSTKDPFQNECPPDVTALLQQLFEFSLPTEKSKKVSQDICFSHRFQSWSSVTVIGLQGDHKMCTSANVSS